MLTLFRNGGFSMYFVVGFGLVSLGWAALYAARGEKKPLGFVHAMMLATLFATGSGTVSDFGATFTTVASLADLTGDQRIRMLIEGAGESMAPGIMGLSLLALTALLLAAGASRVLTVAEA